MSVSNGSRANQTTFNDAFVSRTVDTSTVGKLDLENVDAESGASIENVQRELNALNAFAGKTVNSDEDETPTWTSNDVGTSGDDLKERAEALSAEFNATTGHSHSGVAGDGGTIDSANVTWDPVDTGYDADNVQDGIIAASDRIEFVFDIASTHADAIADVAQALDDHINDAADAHDASAISFNNVASGLTATQIQAAVDELSEDIDAAEVTVAALLDEFDDTTGHDHDGTDSKKVLGTNIDSTGADDGDVLTADGAGGAAWEAPTGGGGGTITAWALDTDIAPGGAGTVTGQSIWSRRVGDSLEIRGHFTTGTVAASAATLVIGGSRSIDTAKMSATTNKQAVGYWNNLSGGGTNINTDSASGQVPLFHDGSSTTTLNFTRNTASSQYSSQDGSDIWASATGVSFFITAIPIDGWDA